MRLTIAVLSFCLFIPVISHSQEQAMSSSAKTASAVQPAWIKDSSAKLEAALVAKYGEAQRARHPPVENEMGQRESLVPNHDCMGGGARRVTV